MAITWRYRKPITLVVGLRVDGRPLVNWTKLGHGQRATGDQVLAFPGGIVLRKLRETARA